MRGTGNVPVRLEHALPYPPALCVLRTLSRRRFTAAALHGQPLRLAPLADEASSAES